MYEGAVKMMAKQKVALDCLSYHASAAIDDTEELAKAAIPTANTYSLHRYEYILNTVFVFVLRKRKTKVIHTGCPNKFGIRLEMFASEASIVYQKNVLCSQKLLFEPFLRTAKSENGF